MGFIMRFRFFAVLCYIGAALSGHAQTPLLDCSCLSTQSALFTNACAGYVPDLCQAASNCYSSSILPAPGYTCSQTPTSGTFVTTSTLINFVLAENLTGLSTNCQVMFNLGVTTNSFMLVCPPPQVVPCDSTNWTFSTPGWTNTCCTNVTVTLVSLVTNWPVITANWTGVDCNGTTDFCSQSITFGNTNGTACACLDIFCPSNIVVQTCLPSSSSAGGFTNLTYPTPTATNYCLGTITNIICTPPSGSPFPVGTNIVTCVVYDSLGNTGACHFDVIVLGDTTPPDIVCAGNQTYQCGSAWTPIPPTAFDACCGTNVTTTLANAVTNFISACQEQILFTWDVMDCNGNHTNCTDLVTIVDTTPPVINCRSNYVVQGNTGATGVPWQPTPPTAVDACWGTNITVTLVSMVTNSASLPCNATLTLTWQAVDCCTNAAFCTEIVTLMDTNPPVMTCASNKTVECGTAWTFDPPTAVDACCGTNVTITVLSNVTVTASTCLSVYTRYWMATDCCTNAAFCSQTVTVVDTTPPQLICASNKTVQCGSAWTFDPPTAVDACCGTNVTITVLSNVTDTASTCLSVYTRYWMATDCCTNAAFCSQTVTVADTTPPQLICASNKTVQCGSAWTFDPPAAMDACCGTNVTITMLSTVTNTLAPCSGTITRTWQATDCCSNSATCSQVVTLVDTTPPVIACASNQVVQCDSAWTPLAPAAIDDCCGTNVTVSLLSATTNTLAPCLGLISFVWQAVDCCGNKSFCTNSVTIVDTIPPVITCRSNYVVQCGSPILPPLATDNCCSNPTVTMLNVVTNLAGTCNQTLTITWQAQDCCTNTSTCTEVVQIVDTAPPVFVCPSNKTVECGKAWTFDPPTAMDACCGTNVTIVVVGTTTNASSRPCTAQLTRTWKATDCCTNSALCSQTVTVADTTPPVTTCASNFTVSVGTPWNFTPPTAVDACCGTNVTIAVIATTSNYSTGNCQIVNQRVWMATDCCGNSTTCTQTVFVQYAPPYNDACSNALPIVVNAPYLCGYTTCATPSNPGDLIPAPCGNSLNSPDVWYTVTAICTGPMTVDTCAPCPGEPAFDTVLSIYNGNGMCPGPLSQIACNDNAGGSCGLRSLITFNAVAGQTYLVRVSGNSGAIGWFSIRAQQTSAMPPNDLCANAIPVAVGSTCGSTICATPSPPGSIPTPCGYSVNTPDVWYTFTPQCNGLITLNTCGACAANPTFNTVLSVYAGQCNSLTAVACNDDATSGPCAGSPQSQVIFSGVAGVTYFIRVSGAGPNSVGQFLLNVSQAAVAPPPNDLCSNATPITAGVYPWNNCGANTDGPTNACQPLQDVWFQFTAPCDGPVWLNTCGSTIDTVMSVYTGTCGSLSLVGCNDKAPVGSGPCGGTLQSFLSFNATAGTTYLIRVGSAGAATGAGMLTLVGPNPPLPTCPPAGVCAWNSWRYFKIIGDPNCIPWGWSLMAPCCANLQNTNVPPVCSGDANTLAAAFVNSINAAACPGVTAVAIPAAFPKSGRFGICSSCPNFVLAVGAAGVPPQNMCVVPNPAGYVAIPVGWCSFNPDIEEIPLTGADLNENGFDDGFDIDMGTALDVNLDGIPDEVQSCLPPVLAAEPQSQVLRAGDPVKLTLLAYSGSPPTIRWTCNGVLVTNGPNVSGATTSSLTITALTTNEVGDYTVTCTSLCGSITTTPATISMEPAVLPVLYNLNVAEGGFNFSVDTRIGFNYLVEYKNDLNDPAWTPLNTLPGSGQTEKILDSGPLPKMRYYHVIEQPQP